MKKTFLHLLLPALILSAGLAWDLWAQSTQQYTAPVPYDSGQLELAPDGAGNLYPVLHRGNFGGTTNGVAKLDGSGNVVDTSWTYPTGSAAAPGAGSCISAKQTWVQTSGGNAGLLFTCPNGASSTPVAQTAFGDNFNQITGSTGTITASGASTVQMAAGDGMLSTPATTGPNKVTINFGVASQAQGDVIYRGASAWSRLGAGTSGQVLQTAGAGANPAWSTTIGQQDGARVTHSANQSIVSATNTALAFDTASGTGYYNRNAVWASGTNTRLTCKTAGVVMLTASIEWAGNSSGNYRVTRFRLNGATIFAGQSNKPNANVQEETISMIYNCALNDYFEVLVGQDSGAGLNVVHDTAPISPLFMMQYLSQ